MNILSSGQRIHSPMQLAAFLEELKNEIASGNLVQNKSASSALVPSPSILEIQPSGPWPDVFEMCFEATRASFKYVLSVETYHGVGGEWRIYEQKS